MTTTRGRLALLAVIILAWFGVFEASLRVAGSSEADPTFRNLFTLDPVIGYRLHPSTSIRYTTSEFSTDAPSATCFVQATTSSDHLNVCSVVPLVRVNGFASAPVMPTSGTF